MIKDELRPDDPLRDYVEEIAKAARRATDITQLLVFNRRQLLEPRIITINAVISHIEKMLMS